MRLLAALAGLVSLAACSSVPSPPPGGSTLTLNNPYWDKVNVQLVITKSSDCENRSEQLSTRELVMIKNKLEIIAVPSGGNVCWRRDRNPNNPSPGTWTGWTKATMFPGRDAEANL